MTHRKLKLDSKGEPIWRPEDKYVSWAAYERKDIGRLVEFALSNWRGVLLSVSPSGELLTVRVYGDAGQQHFYGRTLWEIFGRMQKARQRDHVAEEMYKPRPVQPARSDSGDSDLIMDTPSRRGFKSMAALEDELRRNREVRMQKLREELQERHPKLFKRR